MFHSFIHSFIHSVSQSVSQSVSHSFIHSFIHSVSQSVSHSFIQSVSQSVIHSLIHSFGSILQEKNSCYNILSVFFYLSQSSGRPRASEAASSPAVLPFFINLRLFLSAFSFTRMSSTPSVNPWNCRNVVKTLARAVSKSPAIAPP